MGFIKIKMKVRGNISKSQSLYPEQDHFNVDSPFKKLYKQNILKVVEFCLK